MPLTAKQWDELFNDLNLLSYPNGYPVPLFWIAPSWWERLRKVLKRK